jgi:hypothetical protein
LESELTDEIFRDRSWNGDQKIRILGIGASTKKFLGVRIGFGVKKKLTPKISIDELHEPRPKEFSSQTFGPTRKCTENLDRTQTNPSHEL